MFARAQVVDVVIRHALMRDTGVDVVGRAAFPVDGNRMQLGGGLQLWSGFQQARLNSLAALLPQCPSCVVPG